MSRARVPKNAETLKRLGGQIRLEREVRELSQTAVSNRVRGLRQATISDVERGGDVTLDTFISLLSALGLEIAIVPVGQAQVRAAKSSEVRDLLQQFDDLKDAP